MCVGTQRLVRPGFPQTSGTRYLINQTSLLLILWKHYLLVLVCSVSASIEAPWLALVYLGSANDKFRASEYTLETNAGKSAHKHMLRRCNEKKTVYSDRMNFKYPGQFCETHVLWSAFISQVQGYTPVWKNSSQSASVVTQPDGTRFSCQTNKCADWMLCHTVLRGSDVTSSRCRESIWKEGGGGSPLKPWLIIKHGGEVGRMSFEARRVRSGGFVSFSIQAQAACLRGRQQEWMSL